MTAEFNCLFGISDPVDGLAEGDVDTVFDKGRSSLTITGKGGRVYWFYHEKLDRVYFAGDKNFPRYSKADAEKLALRNARRHVNETVTLGQLWENRVSYALVPLEEALFQKWSWRRIATVGDNAHKMTPNHGQAGNNAIESATALANQLKTLHDDGVFTTERIELALREWQDKRQSRVNATAREAAAVCRMQPLDSRLAYLVMNYVVPNATESLLTMATDTLIGAEILEYLPVPDQSFEGSCPFNPNQGIGKNESLLKRAAMVAPLLLLFCFEVTSLPSKTVESSQLHYVEDINGQAEWLTRFRFRADASLIYSLWLIESNRRANTMTLARFPLLFFLFSFNQGLGVISPVYCALHFVFSSVGRFAASDARLADIAYTRTILPLVLISNGLCYFFGTAGYFIGSSRPWWHLQWALEPPAAIAIAQWILVRTGLSTDSIPRDTACKPLRDVPHILRCVAVLGIISTGTWMLTVWSTGIQLLLWQMLCLPFGMSLVETNHFSIIISSLTWVGLLLRDIKRTGMLMESWRRVFAIGLICCVTLGPATTIAFGWIWREHLLASKRDKDAITKTKYAGRSIAEFQKLGPLARGADKN